MSELGRWKLRVRADCSGLGPRERRFACRSRQSARQDAAHPLLMGFQPSPRVRQAHFVGTAKSSSRSSPLPPRNGWWWDVWLMSLFLTRFFVPTEAGDRGLTLWIAAAWWLLAAGRCWWLWRDSASIVWRWTVLDAGVLALVGGHLLSGTLILLGEGDRRAALNLMWEWSSLGVFYVCLKQGAARESLRELLTRTFLISLVALSLLGLWQNLVWYPQQAAQVNELLELQERIERRDALTPDERRRYENLTSDWGPELLTLDRSGQMMFLARVRDSVEPIGRFALANTFAGLLAVGLVLLLDSLWRQFNRSGLRSPDETRQPACASSPMPDTRRRLRPLICSLTLLALIGINLLLTKSRTAWVGTVVGIVVLCGVYALRERLAMRRIVLAGLIGLGGVILLGIVAWSFGGLDLEVFSEAPKSLEYRLEYWRATAALLADHPWFGVGPGNFRQHYLRYKLPGSSEEVLDPHNLILDVWANGGLLAVAGLTILIGTLIGRLFHPENRAPAPTLSGPPTSRFLTSILMSGTIALSLVFTTNWLFWGEVDQILLGTAAAWLLGVILVQAAFPTGSSLTTAGAMAGGLALLVHLLAAGGIGMPAITQLLLMLALFSRPTTVESTVRQSSLSGNSPRWLLIGMTVFSLGAVGCFWSGVVPVVATSAALGTGRYLLVVQHQYRPAQIAIEQATASDTLSPEPWQQLAALLWFRWQSGGGTDQALYSAAVDAQQQAIARDPHGPNRYRTLGEWWMKRFEFSRDIADARQAAEALQAAVDRYPHHAQLRAQLALALAAAGESPAPEAAYALELDELNRSRGHLEKTLTHEIRDQLHQLLGVDATSFDRDPP